MVILNRPVRWLILFILLWLGGCASDPVRLDYDQNARFEPVSTWVFLGATADAGEAVTLMDRRVHDALKVILDHRGWQEVSGSGARIGWRWDVIEDTELEPAPGVTWGVGFGIGHRHSGLGFGFRTPAPMREKRHYRLVLEALKMPERQVIWRAESRERLLQEDTPEARTAQIRRLVAEMLGHWPPPGR